MATFRPQHVPTDYPSSAPHGSVWRWLLPFALALLALWGLFGRHEPTPPRMDRSDTTEPARMPGR